jgi:hypothetical protein
MHEAARNTSLDRLAIAHGAFDVVTGVWPLVSLRSFELITGPKLEGWLVKTAGTLIATIGGVMMMAGKSARVTPEIEGLAIGSAAGLAAIDIVYAGFKKRISPVYLLDAAVEIGIVAIWLASSRRRRSSVAAAL